MKLAILFPLLAFASALIIVSYRFYAEQVGWPIGEFLYEPGPWLSPLCGVGLLGSAIIGFIGGSWWGALFVVMGGFVTGFALTMVLKWRVQIAALVGLPMFWLLSFLYLL